MENSIGRSIANKRELIGISQSELARRIKKSHVAINRIESGKQTPSVGMIRLIAHELRMSIGEMFK